MRPSATSAEIASRAISRRTGLKHEIVIASCTEYPTAWVFGYNTRASLTGDFTAGLLGNGPVIVGKADGSVTLASSAFPVEQQLPPQA